jgi:hypothetical protein
MLANTSFRADVQAISATQVQFASTVGITVRPIRLWAVSGRQAAITALPTAGTVSGGAGTKYIYASLAAPSGDPYATASGGLLDKILSLLPWNRADWYETLRCYHPGDGTLIPAARNSVVTLVITTSATPPDTHHFPLGEVVWDGAAITSIASYEAQSSITTSVLITGQCRLVKSGVNLVLQPFNGNSLVIGGVSRAVASPTLAATSLTPGTVYYIYAAWSGSAVTLEASTTGHSTHTDGTEIKTGDSTRTLVGMARVTAGPLWSDTGAQRTVLSYFNRREIAGTNELTTVRTTTSTTFVEVHNEIRSEFLTWGDEAVVIGLAGTAILSTTGNNIGAALAIDNTTPLAAVMGNNSSTTRGIPLGCSAVAMPAEGFHYLTMLGAVQSGTGSYQSSDATGSDNGAKCRTFVMVRG